MIDPCFLMDKIQRLRGHGLDVITACDLVAEQHDLDDAMLAEAHFAWQLEAATHVIAGATNAQHRGNIA